MDFRPDALHQDIIEMVHDLAVGEIGPLAAQIDRTGEFPASSIRQMAQMGLMGIPFPERYGGSEMDTLAYVQTIEELSKYCGATGAILTAHTSLCCAPIYQFGTEEQRQRYLSRLCAGEWLGAFALTEQEAGCDIFGQQTMAVDAGDHWVLNGSKTFITNGGAADIFFVLAVTGQSGNARWISAFIVEKGFHGFFIGRREDQTGIRASSTCRLIFKDCLVPKGNLVGRPGRGLEYAQTALDGACIGIAAQALGIAEGAIEETVKYVRKREQFGGRLSQFQNTQFELAQMQAGTEAAKLLVYQAACAKDDQEIFSHKAAMAKLIASRNASDVTRRCQQLYGRYGCTQGYPIERMMRDAKITEIYGGTSEVQMMKIAGWMGVK